MKLFTKTWKNDLGWFQCAIRTVAIFGPRGAEWFVVCEKDILDEVEKIIQPYREFINFHGPFQSDEVWPETRGMDGYHAQQWIKMNAYRLPGLENDYFWNWDSDVLAQKNFTIRDFWQGGRPVCWFSPFNNLMGGTDEPAHQQRRRMLEDIFPGVPVSFEYMRCMPMPQHGQILKVGSATVHWARSLEYCRRGNRNESFSEFNVIGLFSHLFFPDAFFWKNAEQAGPTWAGPYDHSEKNDQRLTGTSIVAQCWSWGGLPDNIRNHVNGLTLPAVVKELT